MKIKLYMGMVALLKDQPEAVFADRPSLFAYLTKEEERLQRETGKAPVAKITWGMNIQDALNRAATFAKVGHFEIHMLSWLPINLTEPYKLDIGMLQASRAEIPNYSSALRKWLINLLKQSDTYETESGKAFVQELEDEKV